MQRVLLVDDELGVLKAIQRLVRREDYECVCTDRPDEALGMMRAGTFAAIVSDQRMPEMRGTDLLEQAREISPDTVRMILTGYVDIEAAVDAINRGAVCRFITKPWNDDELKQAIGQAVSQFEMVSENRRLHALTERQNAELRELNKGLEGKVAERTKSISELNRQLSDSFLGSIRVMAGLAEMHSSVIGSHSKRTAALCKATANYMRLPESEKFQIEVAATLHDIGKIGILPATLKRSESLMSPRELQAVRRHVIQGEAMLELVPNVGEAPRLVRHHHERFDGQGYPDRLKGREIPLGARIIAVADEYDNVLNKRSFFQSTTPDKALRHVRSRSPAALDPEIVSVFGECLARLKETLTGVEVEVSLKDLQAGMVLSRELRTARGVLLLPKDSMVQESQLDRIQNFCETNALLDAIFVYRKPPKRSTGTRVQPEFSKTSC